VAGIESLQQLRPFGERRLRKTTPWRDIFLWRQQLFFKSPQECEAKFLIF